MQKIISLLFLVIFLASTTGVIVESHYCEMKKCKTENSVKKKCCSDKTEKHTKGCCKNEIKVIKISDNFRSVQHEKQFIPVAVSLLIPEYSNYYIDNDRALSFLKLDESPPDQLSSPSFLQVFRI